MSFMKGINFSNMATAAYWLLIYLKGHLRDNQLP